MMFSLVDTLADPLQLHVSSSLDKNLCAPCTDVFLFDEQRALMYTNVH